VACSSAAYGTNSPWSASRLSKAKLDTEQARSSSRASTADPGGRIAPWQSDTPRPIARPCPHGPRSYGRNPTGSAPSYTTATRARGRTRPTTVVNSGSMNGLRGVSAVARSSRHRSRSPSPSSSGLSTRVRPLLTCPPDQVPPGPLEGTAGERRPVGRVPSYCQMVHKPSTGDDPAVTGSSLGGPAAGPAQDGGEGR